MTPEERANKLSDEWGEDAMTNDIASAIREAVKEEREACACVAEECSKFMDWKEPSRHIAGCIRNRKSK